MTSAIGYTRLSQDSDFSIDRQKRQIREYCDEHELELEGILNDGRYSSGFDAERTEYQRVRARVREGTIDAVVVNDRTRIGRDFDERMRFVLDLRQGGVELHTALDGKVDLDAPSKVVFESFHAAKDDEGKREEIEKSKQAVRERTENGIYHGTPPIGMEFTKDGKYLRRSEKWDDVEEAFRLFGNTDLTLGEISEQTEIGVSTLSRMRARGKSWYEGRLETFGMT